PPRSCACRVAGSRSRSRIPRTDSDRAWGAICSGRISSPHCKARRIPERRERKSRSCRRSRLILQGLHEFHLVAPELLDVLPAAAVLELHGRFDGRRSVHRVGLIDVAQAARDLERIPVGITKIDRLNDLVPDKLADVDA